MQEWTIAYLVTCLVEIPIVVALVRGLGWRSERQPGVVTVAWLLQCTQPVLWLARPVGLLELVVAELAIIAVEGAGLYWWAISRANVPRGRGTVERALLIAFIANAASLLVGLAWFAVRGFVL